MIVNARHRQQALLEQTRLVIERLERISADSIWARRASGHRGNLLKWMERLENSQNGAPISEPELERLQNLLYMSFNILENAARERLR